jgi:hydroxymethylglutaryl-CoA lyase
MKRFVVQNINKVKIVEVGARDGLQGEIPIGVKHRINFINMLTDSGFKQIETGSLVKLKSMKNSDYVYKNINKRDGIEYPLLVLNKRGADEAAKLNAKHISLVISPSNTFCKKNMGKNYVQVKKDIYNIMDIAKQYNMNVRGYISTIAVCPYEGNIDPNKVSYLTQFLSDIGCYEISLGDTTGQATQDNMMNILDSIKKTDVPFSKLAGHYHDTYDLALQNVIVSLNYGITTFDSSISGLGGCPFAPGASGNLSTQKLVKFLNDNKIRTDLNNKKIEKASDYILNILNKQS